jgi:hypothetical protein
MFRARPAHRRAGRSLTTIVLNSHPADSVVMLYSSYDGIEVRDLTIDVASVGNEICKRDGLVLAGSDTVVERIGVKHVYGNASTTTKPGESSRESRKTKAVSLPHAASATIASRIV